MKDTHRPAAETLLQQLEEREEPPVLQALADLINEGHPRKPGWHQGRDRHNGDPRVVRVAELMRSATKRTRPSSKLQPKNPEARSGTPASASTAR